MEYETKVIRGESPGPISIILGGVHGDETCGVDIVMLLQRNLYIEKGTVYLCIGNPRAVEQNRRYTEQNLNRMFRPATEYSAEVRSSYEFQRAQELKAVLLKGDALLDLHASPTLGSPFFAICEENAMGIVSQMPLAKVASGFNAVEPGGTDYFMSSNDRIGVCVECGYQGDPTTRERASQVVDSFLKTRGHIDGPVSLQASQEYFRLYRIYYSKSDTFRLAKSFFDFEFLAKGSLLGVDGNEKVVVDSDSYVLFAQNCDRKGAEAVLLLTES
jgi:uncharacterized protein